MKTKLLLLMLSCAFYTFGQNFNVSTNTYTVPQLVQEVLLNSPCLQVNNISWRTGTQFGSSNGIGYFQNSHPGFPLQSGVILSTGNVMNAGGPNTSMLSDGSVNWPGDTDLENILSNAGINMNSINATVLEFEFTALSTFFDFDFLFASEEYGNFQCQFSDAFAFLLTNMNTGVTTNLAIVPGTNTPISVVTVRNQLYNSSCNSENEQYFGVFNGGANAATAATNYNGQTVVMNASATLIPNTPYKIKLVIADRNDPQSDSAIFLSANSFNIGQNVLGDDLTSLSGNAICFGDNHTIVSNLNPTQFTFEWKRNGAVLFGETGPNLTVSTPGVYTITYTNIAFPCQIVSDDVVVEFQNGLNAGTPTNLVRCDTGATSYVYNLSLNTPRLIQGLTPIPQVTYHISSIHAQNGTNPLPTNYTGAPNQTIFARIQRPNSNCFDVKSFQLMIAPPPSIGSVPNQEACAIITNPTRGRFPMNTIAQEILGDLDTSIYQVLFYTSESNALSNTGPITAANYSTISRTVFARLQLIGDPSCFSMTSFELTVRSLPLVDELEDVIVCEYYILPEIEYGLYFTMPMGNGEQLFAGDMIIETQRIYIFNEDELEPSCPNQSSFMVTIILPESIDIGAGTHCDTFSIPSIPFGAYFSETNGNGEELTAGTILTESQTVHFYFQSTEPPFCVINIGFDIEIIPGPQVDELNNVFDCTSYTLPELQSGEYFTEPDGQGDTLAPGTLITETSTIYIYAVNGECSDQSSFTVYIGIDVPTSVSHCVRYTLPPLPIGGYFTEPMGQGFQIPAGTTFMTNQTVYVYAPSFNTPNCTDNLSFDITIELPQIITPENAEACEAYVLPELALGTYHTGPNGSGNALQPGDLIFESQTLHVYLNNGIGCQNSESFEVTVHPRPFIDPRDEIDVCHFYVLTELELGNYFTGPNGTGEQLPGGYVLEESMEIFIFAEENGCTNESSFLVNVFTIEADIVENVISCDHYILPQLNVGNRYFTAPDGPFGTGIELLPGQQINTSQTIFIFIESGERINCLDQSSFEVTIVTTPVANPVPAQELIICDTDGTNDGNFNFNWSALSSFVLGNQNPEDYSINYYTSLADANTNSNSITSSDVKTVYVKISHVLSDACHDIRTLQLTVNKLPEPTPVDGIICYDTTTETVLNPFTIQSGLSAVNHTFEWFLDDELIAGATGTNYTAQEPGLYFVIATNISTGCASEPTPIVVSPSEPATITFTTSNAFSNTNSITVNATGTGDYEYSLNDGPFQDSPVFSPVRSGTNYITVRDKNGCGITTGEVLVINYPPFFTPNGDGYNDQWHITDLEEQDNAVIYIYDRYGKIMTQIFPRQPHNGWDGTYNGQPMPSTDYWFTVNFEEDGIVKEFKSHFSLKR
ncbi:MAG: choice-of-anchor L domain-containing protein [Flavobacterium sp.]